MSEELRDLVAAARALVEWEEGIGNKIPLLPLTQKNLGLMKEGQPTTGAPEIQGGRKSGGSDKSVHLAQLAAEAATCTKCGLHASRTKSVFARGSADSPLVFVGEGPGYNEDQQGLPFVGPAGQLLDKMVAAMGYGRDDVYICNVVKCRPPENRTPLPNEAAACEPYLTGQLQTIAPRVIVALGKSAGVALGCFDAEARNWRGAWKEWKGIPVMPTFHPAYLLRSPEQKKPVWADLQAVMKRLKTG